MINKRGIVEGLAAAHNRKGPMNCRSGFHLCVKDL